MTIALAKYLVEHSLVSAAEMDDVLQRQVIFGGSLDTNLLEAGRLDEATLAKALGEVHHLPVATPKVIGHRDPRLAKQFPGRLAQKYHVLPVMLSGRSLLVLVSSRPHPTVIEEVSFMLSLAIKPCVVCEARLQLLLREWMGIEIEPRFVVLGERLGAHRTEGAAVSDGATAPALDSGRVEKVMGGIEAAERQEQAQREKARSGRISLEEATQACLDASNRDQIVDVVLRYSRQFFSFVGLFVVNNDTILGWDAVGGETARERIRRVRLPMSAPSVLRTVVETRAHFLGPIPTSGLNDEFLRFLGRARPKNAMIVPVLLKERAVGLLYGESGERNIRGNRLVELLVFVSRLSSAFEQMILKKKAEEKEPRAAILPESEKQVRENAAVEAVKTTAGPGPAQRPSESFNVVAALAQKIEAAPQSISTIGRPPDLLDAPPAVAEAASAWSPTAALEESGTPPMPSDQLVPAVDAVELNIPTADLLGLGPKPGEEAVRVEEIEERAATTVSVVDGDTEVVVVDDLENAFAPMAKEEPRQSEAMVLESASMESIAPLFPPARAPIRPVDLPPPPPPLLPDSLPAVDHPPEKAAFVSKPEPETANVVPAPERQAEQVPKVIIDPQAVLQNLQESQVEKLADDLVSGNIEGMTKARQELLAFGPSVLPQLMARFPGFLTFDVSGSYDTVPPLAEHSELLRCLLELGGDVAEAVAQKLEEPASRVRYYAVKMLGEIQQPKLVLRLAKRLYDREALIRMTAIDVLQNYRKTTEFDGMLGHLRLKLRDDNPDQQAIAAALLGNFRDRDALPLLIDLVKSSHKMVARAALESLSFITKQDLGASERKWLKWWKLHKGERRVQWLIAGLGSKNRDIRFSSAQDLAQLTREYFGYYFDSSKDEREKAIARWESWWQEKGRRMHFNE